MAGDTRSHHQFVVSNVGGVVIRCCIHCGLSHQKEAYQDQTGRQGWIWNLVLEEREDETFAEPCPGESGSDDLFPYHHFILSNYHRQVRDLTVIRFCARCGLSHSLVWMYPYNLGMQEVPYPANIDMHVPIWQHIKENGRDMTVSDLCPVEQGGDALKRRYLLVPKN